MADSTASPSGRKSVPPARALVGLLILVLLLALPQSPVEIGRDPGVLATLGLVHDRVEESAPTLSGAPERQPDPRASSRSAPAALVGHLGRVLTLAYSPDGRLLASGSRDGTLKLWNTSDGKQRRSLKLGGAPTSLAFSSDGRALAFGVDDGQAGILTVADGEPLALSSLGSSVVGIGFLPGDDRIVATSLNGETRIWNAASRQPITSYRSDLGATRSALAPAGDVLAEVGLDGKVRLVEAASGRVIRELRGLKPGSTAQRVTFSADGRLLAVGADDGSVSLWSSTGSGNAWLLEPREAKRGDGISSLAFSGDGGLLAAGLQGGRVDLYETATRQQVAFDPSGSGRELTWDLLRGVSALCFSPDGEHLAGGAGDWQVHLWDLTVGYEAAKLVGDGLVSDVGFAPDGRLLAVSSTDGSVALWETATRRKVGEIEQERQWGALAGFAFSADGRLFATGSVDGTVRLWDAGSLREVEELRSESPLRTFRFSPDGKILATSHVDGTVGIWDLSSGREVQRLQHGQSPMALAFSPDGHLLASGGDGAVKVWEVVSGRQVLTRAQRGLVTLLEFSPDGRLLASRSLDVPPAGAPRARPASLHARPADTLELWDTSSGRRFYAAEQSADTKGLVFAADGPLAGRLLSLGWDGSSASVRDVTGGRVVQALGNTGAATRVAVTRDLRLAAASTLDGSVALWRIGAGK